jgi:hypothetical protein
LKIRLITLKTAFLAVVAALSLGLSPEAAAQEHDAALPGLAQDFAGEIGPEDSGNQLFLQFAQGAAASWLTRIVDQKERRSNFVFRDFLAGLYFGMELRNIEYIIPTVRIAAYYPFTSTFNQVLQKPTTPLHFGVDFLAGVGFEMELWKFLVSAGPGLHLFFLNADRWNYLDLGAAAFVGVEFPLNSRWSLLAKGFASLDSGNLGANRLMEPFDIAYQYQVDFGFRYKSARGARVDFSESAPKINR